MKPRIDFYLLPVTTELEVFKYACRLTEKSYLSQQQTFIWTGSQEAAEQINASLWTFKDISFIPHAFFEDFTHAEPVLISFKKEPQSGDVLINLTEEVPVFFNRFKRVIEPIANNPDSIAQGRKKYRIYREYDCELFSHDLKIPSQ